MTELIWEGKYDKDHRRVAPLRIALPFQTVETVNESGQVRAHQLSLFQQGKATDWRNRLIWGDKKYVLPSLLEEFAGKVNLIYIDPPFATGANFSFTTTIPESDEALEKEPSMIEQKAYRDMWGRGLDSYLQWFNETVVLLRDLLTEDGCIYVHLDYRLSHYAKSVLDEVFGADNFYNDIRWVRSLPHNDPTQFGRSSDTILYFAKSSDRLFRPQYLPQKEESVEAHYRQDSQGRSFQTASLLAPGGRGPKYVYKGFERNWRFTEDKLLPLEAEGRIFFKQGQMPRRIYYLDESLGSQVQDVWADISPLNSMAVERTSYPTQKPEALLDRIIRASSNEGDLVLDCFCARAGTAVVTPLNPPASGGRPEEIRDGGRREALPDERIETALSRRRKPDTMLASAANPAPSPLAGRVGVGSTPIEDIHPGDWVLAHDGRAHRVTRTPRRRYHGEMIGMRRADSETVLWLTPDHRVLCPRRVRVLSERGQWSAIAPNHFDRARELRREMSPPERQLWTALCGGQMSVKFRRQHPIGPYIADFYARDAGLVVEVDGDAAHGGQEAAAYDRDRDDWMRSCGLRVLRFSARDVLGSLDAVAAVITRACQEHVLPDAPDMQWRFAGALAVGDTVYEGPDPRPHAIVSIERLSVDEEVYDLEVEDAHSFLTTVCAVHNCGSGTSASSGRSPSSLRAMRARPTPPSNATASSSSISITPSPSPATPG